MGIVDQIGTFVGKDDLALSTEQFERIVGKAELLSTAEQPHRVMLPDGTFTVERRQESRFPFGQRARIRLERVDQAADWKTVMLQDISLSGISFLCDHELEIDGRLALCVKDQAGELITIRCIVHRCEPGGFGGTSFTIGAKFQQVTAEGSKESPEVGGEDGSEENVTDPFSALLSSGANEEEEAPRKMNQAIHRAANIFNPARWWSHLTREYDDFTATGTGSNLSKEMLTKIAQTMESYPTASPSVMHAPSEEVYPSGQSSPLPRRSSIFLHADDAPPAGVVAEPPAAAVQSKGVETPATVVADEAAVVANETTAVVAQPPVAVKASPVLKTAAVEVANASEAPAAADLDEFARWARRDLSDKRYVYMWAGELILGTATSDSRVMVLLGAVDKGQIELIALQATSAASPATWKKLLLNVMRRGLIKPPKLAIGERTLGFWSAFGDFARSTARQYCWNHQIAHILSLLPKGMQRLARKELQRISGLSKREEAMAAIDLLAQDFQADAAQAASCLAQEKGMMLNYFDFPAEHWSLLRSTSLLQKMFEIDGPIKRDESMLMDEILAGLLKKAQAAQASWPNLPEAQRLAEVLRGEQFIDGVKPAA